MVQETKVGGIAKKGEGSRDGGVWDTFWVVQFVVKIVEVVRFVAFGSGKSGSRSWCNQTTLMSPPRGRGS